MRAIAAAALAALVAGGAGAATYDLETRLAATGAAAGDGYGGAVALSGGAALIGAPLTDGAPTESGSAFLIDLATGTERVLTASDAAANDFFGRSVAMSGNTAVIGSPVSDGSVADSGAAYLFDVATGSEIAKLTASDGATGDLLGWSVAISGNTALVGAWGASAGAPASGAAYLFDTTSGGQIGKLAASDGDVNDFLGWSVALSGTTALVGAPGDFGATGAAYLFDTATGRETRLVADDPAADDLFGISVAVSGTVALVGASADDDTGTDSGSVYLFDVATGAQIAKLTAPDGAADAGFGRSLAIAGNLAIVGAPGASGSTGSAYVFDVTSQTLVAQIMASDGLALDLFGSSVAIEGPTALVGAQDSGGTGAAYLYASSPSVVPLPAAGWLLLAGLGGLGLIGRRA